MTTEPIVHFVFSVVKGEQEQDQEQEDAQESDIVSRTDDWSTVALGDQALLISDASKEPTDDNLQQLGDVLESKDVRFDILREVYAFLDSSGAKVIRISANRRGQGSTTTVGFEVERRDGLVLKATPIAAHALGIAKKEEDLEKARHRAPQIGTNEQASDADLKDKKAEVKHPKSPRRPK